MYIHIIHEKHNQGGHKVQTLSARSIQTQVHPETKMMFWFLFASSRGAASRVKIVRALQKQPYNAHQLSQELSLDYKAIKHHLDTLEKNNMIGKFDAHYGATYFLSTLFEENNTVFDEITTKLNF